MTVDANSSPPIHQRNDGIGFFVYSMSGIDVELCGAEPIKSDLARARLSPAFPHSVGSADLRLVATQTLLRGTRLHSDAFAKSKRGPQGEFLPPDTTSQPLPCADRERPQ